MSKIKTAIIGFGLSGKYFHAPFLISNSNFEIKKVLSSREAEVKETLPHCEVVKNIEDIISDNSIELVINCAPNKLHYEYSKLALESGKHVVVEKPFVIDPKNGRDLIDLAKKKNLTLAVFHNRRWDGDFKTIKSLIEKNELGEIKEFESRFDRFRPNTRPEKWREQNEAGAGVLYDLGPHLIDQAISLFGMPKKIQADLGFQKGNIGVDDYFHLVLIYESLRVILHSTSFGDTSARFRIHGSKKSFVKYGLDSQENSLKAGANPSDTDFGNDPQDTYGKIVDCESGKTESVPTQRGSYHEFYEKLYLSIRNNEEFPISNEVALSIIDIIAKIKEGQSEIQFS